MSGTVKVGGVEARIGRDGQERQALTIPLQDRAPTDQKPRGRHRLGGAWGGVLVPPHGLLVETCIYIQNEQNLHSCGKLLYTS